MKSNILQELMALNLSAEQLAGVVAIMARELAPLEKIRQAAAERQAKNRKGNSLRDSNANSTAKSNSLARGRDIITNLSQEVNINTPLSPLPSKPKPSEPDGFAEFWEIYPKRDGNADRKGAVKAFGPALKRAPLKTILAGAGAYAAHCKAKGKTGTEYVKQARSWLNSDLWAEWQPQETQPAAPVQIIREGTPEWEELKKTRPRLVARDIQTPNGIIRGEYGRAA